MKRMIVAVFLLLAGCTYAPTVHIVKDSYNTNTYSPTMTYAPRQTYSPAPANPNRAYTTRAVQPSYYGYSPKVKKAKKSRTTYQGGIQ